MFTKEKPAIFLDRDGVLTVEKSYVCAKEDMEIFPYARKCVEDIKKMGYYSIVVTNQSGIARGLFDEQELLEMNAMLIQELGVDAVYYCPHHQEGSVSKYTRICDCRKPKTGMIDQACQDWCIDRRDSFMVGDRAADIKTGQNAGLKTILLESGYGTARLEELVKPDYILDDLRDVVKLLKDQKKSREDN